jgi:parvulin-like peptidyl-prolyl isomerase
MLKILRNKKTAKKVWIFLAVIIIPAFTLWGFGSAFRSREESAQIGKIYGKTITPLEFRDAVNAVRVQAVLQFGEKYEEAMKQINFENQAWDRLLLFYAAKKRQFSASDKEVIEAIESYPFFQTKGAFDNKAYKEILQYVLHVQPRVFEEQTRQNLIISKLYNQVTENITVNDQELKDEYAKLYVKLIVDYIASIPADFAKEVKYTEDQLKSYFSKNSLIFKEPLSFNLEYIKLDNLDKIKSFKDSLNKKGVFERIAKDNGITINETGLFAQDKPIPQLGWSAEGFNLISKLKPGQCTSPIQADKNFYILRLKERKEPYIPDFDKIKDKVKESFIKDQSDKLARDKIDAAEAKLKTDNNFAKVAKSLGIKSGMTEQFQFGSYLEGIGASDSLWQAAHALKTEETSPVIAIASGYYIVKLKSASPVDEKKFNDEKADFSLKVLFEKKQDAFDKFLTSLKNKNR